MGLGHSSAAAWPRRRCFGVGCRSPDWKRHCLCVSFSASTLHSRGCSCSSQYVPNAAGHRHRRGPILPCVQPPSITIFCDPLKLAKNIPPPGAGAATRVVTQSPPPPPIEFDSFFHSVSPISRQNPSLVTTLLPLLPSRRVGSLSRTLGPLVFSEHTYRRHFSIYGAASRQVQHPN